MYQLVHGGFKSIQECTPTQVRFHQEFYTTPVPICTQGGVIKALKFDIVKEQDIEIHFCLLQDKGIDAFNHRTPIIYHNIIRT